MEIISTPYINAVSTILHLFPLKAICKLHLKKMPLKMMVGIKKKRVGQEANYERKQKEAGVLLPTKVRKSKHRGGKKGLSAVAEGNHYKNGVLHVKR